jgi:hypothetical protein
MRIVFYDQYTMNMSKRSCIYTYIHTYTYIHIYTYKLIYLGMSVNADSVLRSVYYKYVHPKEVFIAEGILVPDIARKKNTATLGINICIYMYVYIHIHICVCIWRKLFMNKYLCICAYIWAYMCISVPDIAQKKHVHYRYKYINIHIYIYICMYICRYICMYIYVDKYLWIYMYLYVYVHIYEHLCILVRDMARKQNTTTLGVYLYIWVFIHIYWCTYVYLNNLCIHTYSVWNVSVYNRWR